MDMCFYDPTPLPYIHTQGGTILHLPSLVQVDGNASSATGHVFIYLHPLDDDNNNNNNNNNKALFYIGFKNNKH